MDKLEIVVAVVYLLAIYNIVKTILLTVKLKKTEEKMEKRLEEFYAQLG
ncbi:hypothetical protein [Peribacillus frigoritolerans]